MIKDFSDCGLIRQMQDCVDQVPPGHERDVAQRKLDRVVEAVRQLPRRVALLGPFKDGDAARVVLEREVARVVATIDGTN